MAVVLFAKTCFQSANWKQALAKRTTAIVYCSPCCSPVARVCTKLWSADLSAELSSLGQGSPAFKPELLSVGVPNLRHDPDAAVVVTEVWQLFVSEGYAAFGGSKLEQWTEPLEPGTVDTAFVAFLTAFAAVDTALWSFAQVDIFLEASKTQMIPKTSTSCTLLYSCKRPRWPYWFGIPNQYTSHILC
ncbi:TPA: hypothetical protein ACH3X3_009750 [Trebouxia sp. C0006]